MPFFIILFLLKKNKFHSYLYHKYTFCIHYIQSFFNNIGLAIIIGSDWAKSFLTALLYSNHVKE